MKSAPAIAFDYKPSRWLAAAIVAVALLAIAAVVLSGINPWIKPGIGLAVCAYGVLALRRFLSCPVQRVAWHEAGHWRLRDADGEEHAAELRHAVVRGAWIVLNVHRSDGRRAALILAPDNCPAEIQRRLRIRLASVREVDPARA